VRTLSLFEDQKILLDDATAFTAASLNTYGKNHKHWVIAFSGGKDSTATVAVVLHLIKTKQIAPPTSLTILYADTRQELPPLHNSAMKVLDYARSVGCKTQIVLPEMDKRFWVYILGRGVPSPNNGTFRWCTRQIKVDPMMAALEDLRAGLEVDDRLLMLTGVRLGESAVRDQRISTSCSKDGGECGQGWFQNSTAPQTDTLAPILHWRVCHVWDWLMQADIEHGMPTFMVAEAYGMMQSDGEENLSARTGCIGCPLVSNEDTALGRLTKQSEYAYLLPLHRVKQVHLALRSFDSRLQKDGTDRNKDGSMPKNPCRKGALTLDARLKYLDEILDIQREVNDGAIAMGQPTISLINEDEELRIRELIRMKTFPNGWTGDEHLGSDLIPQVLQDGSIQNILPLWG
jgi:DNA sulfur modification protein DndC